MGFYDQRNELRKVRTELLTLKRQLESLQRTNVESPLQNIGSLMTGPISQILYMLCNPANANAVPFPGREPEAQIKASLIPFSSIPLLNGKSNIITTPFGRNTFYRSITENITAIPVYNLYRDPVTIFQKVGSTTEYRGLTIFSMDTQGTNSIYIPNRPGAVLNSYIFDDTESEEVGSGFLIFDVPDLLVGSTMTTKLSTFNAANHVITQGGQTVIGIGAYSSGVNCPATVPAARYFDASGGELTDGGDQLATVVFSALNSSNLPEDFTINWGYGYLGAGSGPYDYVVEANLDSYFGYAVPQIQRFLSGTNDNTSGAFIAASTLCTSDAASTSNAGYINAVTTTFPLNNPSYVDFQTWISEQTHWAYRGPLKYGSYQAYIPDDHLISLNDDLRNNPWRISTNQSYCMVNCVDNSFIPAGGSVPPSATQLHVFWASVYSTSTMNNVLQARVASTDIGFRFAMALLRQYYCPGKNDTHLDAITDWLHNTFTGLTNYGKRIIQSPVTRDLIKGAVTKGAPMLLEALGEASSLL